MTLYDRPCSKCGEYVVFTDARNALGDLADHRVCPVPDLDRPAIGTVTPQRIQQRRVKGWRKPEGAVSVTRSTEWGNPYRVGAELMTSKFGAPDFPPLTITAPLAVALFREWLVQKFGEGIYEQIRRELGGKDLMCFCPAGAPCHADVLLEIANPGIDQADALDTPEETTR